MPSHLFARWIPSWTRTTSSRSTGLFSNLRLGSSYFFSRGSVTTLILFRLFNCEPPRFRRVSCDSNDKTRVVLVCACVRACMSVAEWFFDSVFLLELTSFEPLWKDGNQLVKTIIYIYQQACQLTESHLAITYFHRATEGFDCGDLNACTVHDR